MSFSSLLSDIKHKAKNSEAKPSYSYNPNVQKKSNVASQKPPGRTEPSKPSYRPVKTVDPAVQRLKELRRLENAKKDAQNPKAKTQRQRNPATRTAPVRRRRTPEVLIKDSVMVERPRSSSPQKRLTFAELMNQAQEKSKSLKDGKKEESLHPSAQPHVSKTQPKLTQSRTQRSSSAPSLDSRVRRPITPSSSHRSRQTPSPSSRLQERPIVSKPKEFAKPSAKLQAKLDAKKKNKMALRERERAAYEDQDEYESDFVEDDEEYDDQIEEDVGYDRDEIWKMFSRGKSRRDYYDEDDDLSDMEATGSEVMNEEMRSAKRAKLEEKAEQERERRRLEEKKKRLGKR